MDARVSNWSFLVPSADRFLLLPIRDEDPSGAVVPSERSARGLADALVAAPFPLVGVPALAAWRSVADGDGARLLERLAGAVAPGGWLYVGFPNAWYPGYAGRAGSLTEDRVRAVLSAAGLQPVATYLAFPHERTPAYLIERDDPAALRYFLERLSFPYVEGPDRWKSRGKQLALAAARRGALVAPSGLRARFAPGLAVTARRVP